MASKREENTPYTAREKNMYSGMRSTSALYPSHPCQKKQSSGDKAKPGFGEHHFEQLSGQLHSAMNPTHSTPASYPVHQNQNHGFGMQQGLMMNSGPFYHSVKNSSYSTPQSYPMQQNQNHGFGIQQGSMTNNEPFYHPLKDPGHSTPASYAMHQNQNYGFGVQQSSMTKNGPFYHPGFTFQPLQKAPTYPLRQPAAAQAQEVPTYLLRQPAAAHVQGVPTYPMSQPATAQVQEAPVYLVRQRAAAQVQEAPTYLVRQRAAAQVQEAPTYLVRQHAAAQEQQVEVMRNAEEEVLEVELEIPILSMGKPRLRWTPELHERFIRAATELGGLFKATPKAIQGKMNVRGLTLDHLKSHLQKMRCRNPNDLPAEEIMGQGIQNNAISYAPFTEDEVSSSNRPTESDFRKFGSLLGSSEIPNYQQNLRVALAEEHVNN